MKTKNPPKSLPLGDFQNSNRPKQRRRSAAIPTAEFPHPSSPAIPMPIVTRSGKRRMSDASMSEKSETPPVSTISSLPQSPPQSPPPKLKNEVAVIDLSDDSVSPPRNRFELSGTPLRPVFCVKNREKMKEIENREECFILEFDPDDDESDPVSSDPTQSSDVAEASPELSVLAEKGKVACRDYPHSRHLCIKFPFGKTPHENYCRMCFCYVCDSSAPCSKWSDDGKRHCDAIDNPAWKMHRHMVKQLNKLNKP